MEISSLRQNFNKVVAQETKKTPDEINKDTVTYSLYHSDAKDLSDTLNYFRTAGGMNVFADAEVEGMVKNCNVDVSKDEGLQKVIHQAMESTASVRILTDQIFSPLSAALPISFLDFCPGSVVPSSARKIDDQTIAVDFNKVGQIDEDPNAKPSTFEDRKFATKDLIENDPSFRLYIGLDPEEKGGFKDGFVYVDKLKP